MERNMKTAEVRPRVELYTVQDFFGEDLPGLAIVLDEITENGSLEPFCVLTTNFGEFINIKNAAYVDVNNCPFAEKLLTENGWAQKTQYTKKSGFVEYPLFVFNEELLKKIGGEKYEKYSSAFEEYFSGFHVAIM